MPSPSPPSIVVIGAGVIGLSCALKLQSLLSDTATSSWQVLIVAREWPTSIPGAPTSASADYASMWAGAHVRPIPPTDPQLRREAKWLSETVAELERLVAVEPWSCITRAPGVELLEAPSEGYRNQTAESFKEESGLGGYRRLAPSALPEGVVLGFEYDTYCINSPLYCANLLRKFLLQGGRTVYQDVGSVWEAFNLIENVQFVVNATGAGFGDPDCFPTRGQTVVTNLVEATKTVTRQNKDGTFNFIIPRFFAGGTIIGGTKEAHDWRTTPDPRTRQSLLKGGCEILPYATLAQNSAKRPEDIAVVADVVGRRPTRQGGMRIEVEHYQGLVPKGASRGPVIHAYGAGGRGFEMSWGVASEVAGLAKGLVEQTKEYKSKL